MRLIDADALKEKLLKERDAIPKTITERYGFGVETPNKNGDFMRGGIRKALRCMEQTPTIDAVPVVHGRWNFTDFVGEDWYSIKRAWECSICRHQVESKSKNHIYPKHMKYCPNCGAKMDGDTE